MGDKLQLAPERPVIGQDREKETLPAQHRHRPIQALRSPYALYFAGVLLYPDHDSRQPASQPDRQHTTPCPTIWWCMSSATIPVCALYVTTVATPLPSVWPGMSIYCRHILLSDWRSATYHACWSGLRIACLFVYFPDSPADTQTYQTRMWELNSPGGVR